MHNVLNLQVQRERRTARNASRPTTESTVPPLTYTVEQVAAMLRISRSTAYRCVQSGELPSLRLRRRIVIPADAIEALLTTA